MKKQEESDVEGYSTDDSRKRQREEEENNDTKKKSKKTVRTPPKKKRSDTEMEDLKSMIQKLRRSEGDQKRKPQISRDTRQAR
jgi:cytochrome c553